MRMSRWKVFKKLIVGGGDVYYGLESNVLFRSSSPEKLVGKGVPKICSKCTGEHPFRSAISIKLQSNFIEIALRHGCSPINLLHIFGTLFPKNTSGRLFAFVKSSVRRAWVQLFHFSGQRPPVVMVILA